MTTPSDETTRETSDVPGRVAPLAEPEARMHAKAVVEQMREMVRILEHALDGGLVAVAAMTTNEMNDQVWQLQNAVHDWLGTKP